MAAADVRRPALRERLVVVYLPVARHIARRFAYRGEPVDDLEQVAAIGLLGALERFDPDRDRDFLAYAVFTIMGEVRQHFRDRTWTVRTPRGVKDDYLAVGKAVTSLSQHLDRAPTVPELAEHLGLAADRVSEAITAGGALRPASLDEGRAEGDDGGSLAGVLGELDPDIGRVEVGALVQDLVRALPQRERTILALRFVHDKTQTEIGEVLCISQMHVSRLLRRTLAQLQDEVGRSMDTDPEQGLRELVAR
ncbi:SigB/SigF/SigG family RNA polymerase sigma factor [Actinomycetospora sp. OC33-EN08]|uniref:SigB/SigF/SigG family RNA polymerase sigma factor n=1 Tax=Actinomycetospora aurantiaca TaxID=3129233 RepID=A0ABU8MX35_9PSEU